MPPLADNPDLPAPTATGSFAKTPLSHLLIYAHDRELTGTFDFTGPAGETATVLFLEGQPTKARTPEAKIYLGRVLFELGVLSEEQLAILMPRLLGSTELHGQALLTEGVITEEQLELALRAQLVRQMKWLVHLSSDTTYKYYDSFDGLASYGGDGHVGIDPFPLVWACVRDEPPWEHVHLGLTSIGTAGVQLKAAAETVRFSFDKAERATIDLIRQKPWRVHELTAAETMAPRFVQLLVYCLLVTKQVDLVRESKLPDAPDSEDPISEPPPSSPFSGNLVPPPVPRHLARVQLEKRAAVRPTVAIEEDANTGRITAEAEDGKTSYVATQPRTFKKKLTSSPGVEPAPAPAVAASRPTLPSTPPSSPRPAIAPAIAPANVPAMRSALPSTPPPESEGSAKQAAPPAPSPAKAAPPAEVHTRPTVPRLSAVGPELIAAQIAANEEKARSSRPPAVPEAKVVTESKSPPISGKDDDDVEAEPSPPSPVAEPPSVEPIPMTPELLARKKEIEDRAAKVDKEDFYALLGVARDTPASEVQKAFFGLAKKWHPDRVPAPLADVKHLCAKVFGRMSEAHQTLMDAGKRAKYESSKNAGSDDSPEAQAQVMAILGAATDFQKAEICLKRNDLKQAEEFCRKAIAVEPKQADYISMITWLDSLKPHRQTPSAMQEQVAELTRAIGISQACERAFFYRAMLLKRLGQEAPAMKDFKRAVELNPRNVDATRELRLYNMRGGDKAKPAAGGAKKEEGGGIFGRLFKK